MSSKEQYTEFLKSKIKIAQKQGFDLDVEMISLRIKIRKTKNYVRTIKIIPDYFKFS